MSISTAIPPVPTSQLLASIASDSAALARQFGLSPSKASVDAGKTTAVVSKIIEVQTFWGPGEFPDKFPADWK